jgi:signal transduction histidine kinase
MKILGSLTNRIFLASAALAVLSIGFAVYFVSRTTTREAEAELQRGLIEAGALVDQQTATLIQTMAVQARLVGDLPRLKAGVADSDPPTAQKIALEYQKQLNAALLVVTDRHGNALAIAGDVDPGSEAVGTRREIQRALSGAEASGFWPQSNSVLQVVAVPISVGIDRPELLGTLAVGFKLDDALAERFKRVTESDIAFVADGQIKASTLSPGDRAPLMSLLTSNGVQTVTLGESQYVALTRPLATGAAAEGLQQPSPTVLILRSRTERLRFLNAIHTGLAATAIVAVLLATILSYAVARTITRPLATISDVMREMSATGDLTRKISIRAPSSWEDEDATLLATTFNTLTDSIARFQREAAQRERLSSLGRLSTVVAHEIRNPLMIIKASLRTLGKDRVTREEIRQALTDVDEEVARLNRVVNDVLDFARPIRFDYAPTDVNAVCADAEHATRGIARDMRVALQTEAALPPVVTDAERLRTALVNILSNARHAVADRSSAAAGDAPPDIELQTMKGSNGYTTIVVRDHGVGIKPEDMARVFDPYFTTKRTGSGLGLAIAKNIIEGMGGSIVLRSQPGQGTEIRIDIPDRTGLA